MEKIVTFPPKSQFYNSLSDEHISDEEYRFARHVYKTFSCESLADYLMVYLETDIGLLSEVFMTYADKMFDTFGLHPGHYLGQVQFILFLKSACGKKYYVTGSPPFHLMQCFITLV